MGFRFNSITGQLDLVSQDATSLILVDSDGFEWQLGITTNGALTATRLTDPTGVNIMGGQPMGFANFGLTYAENIT